MFAVIRHTFDINKNDIDNMYGDWKHYVWLFESEVDAMAYAITLLDDPLLKANAEYMEHAIEMLHEKRFWQMLYFSEMYTKYFLVLLIFAP